MSLPTGTTSSAGETTITPLPANSASTAGREPRRLWRRYLTNNPRFVWSIVRRPPVLVGGVDAHLPAEPDGQA